MEKWTFDPLEGNVKRYSVSKEVIILEDEFVNPVKCGNCRKLEDKIRSLKETLKEEKRQQAELTRNHQNLLSNITKRILEDKKKLEAILARLREK